MNLNDAAKEINDLVTMVEFVADKVSTRIDYSSCDRETLISAIQDLKMHTCGLLREALEPLLGKMQESAKRSAKK